MIDTLKKLLEESKADAWEIRQENTEGWEFYFIKHKLDQNRAKKVSHTHVTVYRREAEGLGSAQAEFAPTGNEETWKKQLEKLLEEAKYSLSAPYELVRPKEVKDFKAKETKIDIPSVSSAFMKTLCELDETKTHDVNSYEIFVQERKSRYINSNGVDLAQTVPYCFLETVLDARDEKHEIELYRSYTSGGCDSEYLKTELNMALQAGEDRLHTEGTPKLGKGRVLFTTADALQIYHFFLNGLSAGYVYQNVSPFRLNEPITDKETGDQINILTHRHLPESSMNMSFDHDGCLIEDAVLMKENVPVRIVGSRQYSQYLKLEHSFTPGCFEVNGGRVPARTLREGDYLEPIEFSDFQVDMAGNMFGEIRLAYYHHDGKTIPVSGGSVSGNVKELLGGFHMSEELKQYDSALIPAVTSIDGVTITGVK